MKFWAYPYGGILISLGLVVFGIPTLISGVCAVIFPGSRPIFLFIFGDGFLLVVILLFIMGKTSHARFFFDQAGIHKRYLFGGGVSFSWGDCAEIGIGFSGRGAYGAHIHVPWLYFSKIPLTCNQIQCVNKIPFADENILVLRYRKAVLEPV